MDQYNNTFDMHFDAPVDLSFSELHQKPFDTSMFDQYYPVPSNNQEMAYFDMWNMPSQLLPDYNQSHPQQSHLQPAPPPAQQQPTPPFSPAELSLSPMSSHESCNNIMSPPMMQQDMEQLLLAIAPQTSHNFPSTSSSSSISTAPTTQSPSLSSQVPSIIGANTEKDLSSNNEEKTLEVIKEKRSNNKSKKKSGTTRSTRRRTVHDLPYAPNLLNLNLAPTKRIRASSSNSNNNTRHHSSSSQQTRSATPFRCDFPGCDKTFTRPYNLKSHRRTHTLERPFACDLCPKRFARQHDRNRHTKLHYGIKPYVCHICNKAFARQDALNRHQRPDDNDSSIITCASAGHRSRGSAKRSSRKKL
ncbi:hypothetical protein LRAMOSA07318 [Lichtheimia ramosa]|uniref:C2H2-type domain-containing protein n=1 Tax=Lichtheimia ramosa TaxID=688394 RepID=A0A077WCL3_9FUNG|nr:hypothetical protein LRAMOSA07318 [Lichtheimia ramosa]